MIILYSGTPGSGKSLHAAERICSFLSVGRPCICNFPVNPDRIKRYKGEFTYLPNEQLTPEVLIKYAQDYFASHPRWGVRKKEGSIKLFIDEAQLLYNSRDFKDRSRMAWLTFFSQHRHHGYDIYLMAQFDRMLDRQIRSLIEDEYMHRKVANMGKIGWIVGHLTIRPLFFCRHLWYPMKEKLTGEFFVAHGKYYRLYDTHYIFNTGGSQDGRIEDGGRGAPPPKAVRPALPRESMDKGDAGTSGC